MLNNLPNLTNNLIVKNGFDFSHSNLLLGCVRVQQLQRNAPHRFQHRCTTAGRGTA